MHPKKMNKTTVYILMQMVLKTEAGTVHDSDIDDADTNCEAKVDGNDNQQEENDLHHIAMHGSCDDLDDHDDAVSLRCYLRFMMAPQTMTSMVGRALIWMTVMMIHI